jgi:hypothetical protein
MRPIAAAAAVLAVASSFLAAPSSTQASPWRWPVEGPVITPYANGSDPYASGQHRGIDVAAPVGARVVAATAGTVTFTGSVGSSGLTVAIRTDDGFDTSYLHLSSIAVRAADRVAAGAPIGQVGTSGRRSAAEPHLHFGVRAAGNRFAYRDPLDFLPVAPPAGAPRAPVAVPSAVPIRPRANPLAAPPAALPPQAAPRSLPATAWLPHATLASLRRSTRAFAPLSTLPEHAPVRTLPSHAPSAPGQAVAVLTFTAIGRTIQDSGAPAPAQAIHVAAPAAPPHQAQPRRAVPGHAPATGPSRASARHVRAPALAAGAHGSPRNRDRGLDLGWLAACVGLVAAAAILGRPRATTRSLRNAFDFPLPAVRSEPDRP